MKALTVIALPTEYRRAVMKLTDLLSSLSFNSNRLGHVSSLSPLIPLTSRHHLIGHRSVISLGANRCSPRAPSLWKRCGRSISYSTSKTDHEGHFHWRLADSDKSNSRSRGRGHAFSTQAQSMFMGVSQGSVMASWRPLCDVNVSVLFNASVSRSTFSVRTYSTKKIPASHYDILGLTPKASQKQIKSAYYKMSKMYHPDVATGRKGHAKFTEINEAYEILGNIQKRRLYDRGLLHERDPRSPYNPQDMDFPGPWARQSPFERGERPPPPRGRSKIYNFDEFYKQHYNDVRERRSREWNAYMKEQEMYYNAQDKHIAGVSSPLLISVFLLLGSLIIIMTETYGHDQGGYRKKQTEMYDSLQNPASNRKI